MSRQRISIRRRLTLSVIWTVFGAVTAQGSVVAASIIAARLLGKDAFGEFGIIRSTVIMLATIAALGVGITTTKYVAEFRETDRQHASRVMGLCMLIAIITGTLFTLGLCLCAPFISERGFAAPELAGALRLASWYVLCSAINGCQIGILIGLEAFPLLARVNVSQGVLGILCTGICTWRYGLSGAVFALALWIGCSCLLHQYALHHECRRSGLTLDFRHAWEERHLLHGFMLPAALSSVIGSTAVWISNTLLIRQPQGFAELGQYNAANTFRGMVLFTPALVTQIVSPMLCNLRGKNASTDYCTALTLNMAAGGAIYLLAAIGVSLYAPALLTAFGKSFVGGSFILMLMLCSGLLEFAATSLYQVLYSHGKIWWQVFIIIPWSAMLVGITAMLAAEYKAYALATAYIFAWFVSLILYGMIAQKQLRSTGVQLQPAAMPAPASPGGSRDAVL